LAIGWSFLSSAIPIYALYSLLFVDSGLSEGRVSALLAIWSAFGILIEVPSGALADRFSRRRCLVAAGFFQATGHALWVLHPTFAGFVVGFCLWSTGSSLISGSYEALMYDSLAASGDADRYPRVIGRTAAASLLAQIPASLTASGLYALGGYDLVGWVSVGVCVTYACMARCFPDDIRSDGSDEAELTYLQTLRDGFGRIVSVGAVRTAVVAVAVLFGLDAIEEYFPLQASDWGVRTAVVPIVVLTIPLAGAIGAGLTGRGARLSARTLAGMMLAGGAALALSARLSRPLSVLGIVAFYGMYRMVLSVADARLQEGINGSSRATVTSVGALAGELVGIAVFGVWTLGGLALTAAVVIAAGATLPWLMRPRPLLEQAVQEADRGL
jgi:MFS family permease